MRIANVAHAPRTAAPEKVDDVRPVTSQDVGLEAGLVFSRYFFGTEHLHYGYWDDATEARIENLHHAQEAYCDRLLGRMPEEARTVLDVGCGAGLLAQRLLAMGKTVDCVSPSAFLASKVRERVGDSVRMFECRFEDMRPDRTYDVVIFSESFQYLDLPVALEQLQRILAPDGIALICDFFRKDVEGKSHIGGGHRLSKFRSAVSASPFEFAFDEDITKQTAPTIDLANDLCLNAVRPICNVMNRFLDSRYPRISRLVRWGFRKKIDKASAKYFGGRRTAEHFAQFKTYRTIGLRRNGAHAPAASQPS